MLIHGWAGSFADTWQGPGVDALLEDAGRRVVGLDLLGHGTQDKPHDPAAYADLHGWLLRRLESVGPLVDVVGFSLGALTVLRSLTIDPGRYRRVVLAGIGDGVFEPSDGSGHRRIVDALEGKAPEDDTFGRVFAHHGRKPGNDPVALAAVMKRPPDPPLDPESLASVDAEVLVVIGDKDFTAPAHRLATAFPNGRLVELKNVDHFATPESFAFIDALLDFLA